MHDTNHPLSGQTVRIKSGVTDPAQDMVVEGADYQIEDWWDVVSGGQSWKTQRVWATLQYAVRTSFNDMPLDDEVVYGKINNLGHLIHVSEIETP